MFINFTNHPSNLWSEKQILAGQQYGPIVDVAFPAISPMATKAEIKILAAKYVTTICNLVPAAVLCQGEFTFTYEVVTQLKEAKVSVLASCSARKSVESNDENGILVKKSRFDFEQFREY